MRTAIHHRLALVVAGLGGLLLGVATAQDDAFVTFQAGTPIRAAEVNANFAALQARIDGFGGAAGLTTFVHTTKVADYQAGLGPPGSGAGATVLDHPALNGRADAQVIVQIDGEASVLSFESTGTFTGDQLRALTGAYAGYIASTYGTPTAVFLPDQSRWAIVGVQAGSGPSDTGSSSFADDTLAFRVIVLR